MKTLVALLGAALLLTGCAGTYVAGYQEEPFSYYPYYDSHYPYYGYDYPYDGYYYGSYYHRNYYSHRWYHHGGSYRRHY